MSFMSIAKPLLVKTQAKAQVAHLCKDDGSKF